MMDPKGNIATAAVLVVGLIVVGVGVVVGSGVIHQGATPATPATPAPRMPQQAPVDSGPPAHSTLLQNSRNWTTSCLNDRVLALLDIGERNIDLITNWALRHCNGNLAFLLSQELERPKAETDRYVYALVRREVELLAERFRP